MILMKIYQNSMFVLLIHYCVVLKLKNLYNNYCFVTIKIEVIVFIIILNVIIIICVYNLIYFIGGRVKMSLP